MTLDGFMNHGLQPGKLEYMMNNVVLPRILQIANKCLIGQKRILKRDMVIFHVLHCLVLTIKDNLFLLVIDDSPLCFALKLIPKKGSTLDLEKSIQNPIHSQSSNGPNNSLNHLLQYQMSGLDCSICSSTWLRCNTVVQ